MATKAERFRAQQQREAQRPKPKARKKVRRDFPVNTAQAGVSATDRKAGLLSTADRNRSKRAEKRGGARLEDSASGKPSRKSTRKSVGHVKRTDSLRRKAVRAARGSRARAARAKTRR